MTPQAACVWGKMELQLGDQGRTAIALLILPQHQTACKQMTPHKYEHCQESSTRTFVHHLLGFRACGRPGGAGGQVDRRGVM